MHARGQEFRPGRCTRSCAAGRAQREQPEGGAVASGRWSHPVDVRGKKGVSRPRLRKGRTTWPCAPLRLTNNAAQCGATRRCPEGVYRAGHLANHEADSAAAADNCVRAHRALCRPALRISALTVRCLVGPSRLRAREPQQPTPARAAISECHVVPRGGLAAGQGQPARARTVRLG